MPSPSPSVPSEPYSVRPGMPPSAGFPYFWVVLAGIVGAVVGAGASAMVKGGASAPVSVAVPSASAVACPPPPMASSAPPSTIELAANGNADAVKSLEAKAQAERTPAELIALERARIATEAARIGELKRKIELLPDFGRSKEAKKEILGLARDGQHFVATQEMLASLQHEVGADLLFAIWSGHQKSTPASILAESLSRSPEVRSRTSKQLALVLDLETVEQCDAALDLLNKAKEFGDRRVLGGLLRFNKKTGCGENQRGDCWACIRKSDALRDASNEARKRAAPL